MPRLFLLDGTALAYFAFARSGLATADGKATGATHGFTMTLRPVETEPTERESLARATAKVIDPRPRSRHVILFYFGERLLYGPGDIQDAHTAEEMLTQASLEQEVADYERAARKLLARVDAAGGAKGRCP